MKEYKVVSWKMGMLGNNQKLESTLNLHAQSGWKVCHIAEHTARIVFERDKNR